MKKLRITLITLAIFSSIEGFAQKHLTAPARGYDNHKSLEFSNYLNESINSLNSVQIDSLARLSPDKIQSQNKGVRHDLTARWEDSLLEKYSMSQIQPDPHRPITTYITGRNLYK